MAAGRLCGIVKLKIETADIGEQTLAQIDALSERGMEASWAELELVRQRVYPHVNSGSYQFTRGAKAEDIRRRGRPCDGTDEGPMQAAPRLLP